MKKTTVVLLAALAASVLMANPPAPGGGRDAFMKQQAFAEVQRLSGQFDVLESNCATLSDRVRRLEQGGGEVAALKADIAALRADVSRLRADMENQRREIVADLLKRIKEQDGARPPTPPPPSVPETHGTYVVRPGDTLSLIAQALGTTVGKIKAMNNMRGDGLRVGQKLLVPDPGARRR